MKIAYLIISLCLLTGCDKTVYKNAPTPLTDNEKSVLTTCLESSKTMAGPSAENCMNIIKTLRGD